MEDTMSLEATDAESASFAVAPRVSLADIKDAIARAYYYNAGVVVRECSNDVAPPPSLDVLSICLIVMKNGFTIIGKSAPASAENFNQEYGFKLAYEDAVRQIWPHMGFALRDKLYHESQPPIPT
jgi:hypothetical protein